MVNRRDVLRGIGASALVAGAPGLSFANAPGDRKFVLVILRGALDGLAVVPPYGDGSYKGVRGELALSADEINKLDGLFGLHASLENVHRWYVDGQAAIVHAVASPYRERSHFDGQDLLENGATRAGVLRNGWLNRALTSVPGASDQETAIALAQNTPLVLQGDSPVTSWAPSQLPDADDSTLGRLARLYADDEFFSTRLSQAMRSQEIAGDMGSTRTRGNEAQQFASLADSAAKFLTSDDGLNIAVLELGGWDTHANQGSTTGALANRLAALDTGIGSLRAGLGDDWDNTVVAVVTEFGRTVRVNGTRGTDHGTATAAMLLGGAVNGGRILVDWPGLRNRDLYAERDLMPTTDLRSVFKGVLSEHLKVPEAALHSAVFPDSSKVAPLEGLIRV